MYDPVDYRKIRTWADLREEQLRVRYEIAYVERKLKDDCVDIRKMFSWENLMAILSQKANGVYRTICFGQSVYRFVRNWVANLFSGRNGEEQEEYDPECSECGCRFDECGCGCTPEACECGEDCACGCGEDRCPENREPGDEQCPVPEEETKVTVCVCDKPDGVCVCGEA